MILFVLLLMGSFSL